GIRGKDKLPLVRLGFTRRSTYLGSSSFEAYTLVIVRAFLSSFGLLWFVIAL
ncbi:hypothetical protein U1Q18_017323, partial [Sarracenia purpurea var. burkii]